MINAAKKTNAAVNGGDGKVLIAKEQHIGYGQKRRTLEDRCDVTQVAMLKGQGVYLGVVADGIGGANAGEVAGTIAMETIFDTVAKIINDSTRTGANPDLKNVLLQALANAHHAVRSMTRSTSATNMRSMGTTCTATLIYQDKLYVAHLGDSRAYLIRNGAALQLTVDHSWGNDRIRAGTFTPEEIAVHSRRDELMRYIGQPGNIEVDLGVHLEDPVSPKENPQAADGFQLEPGDVVIVCTDGLIKERDKKPGQFYATPEELVSVVSKNSPVDAANTLVSLALGRQVDDNVSVVIMEIPGGSKKMFTGAHIARSDLLKQPLVRTGLAVTAVLLLFVLGAFVLTGNPGGAAKATPTTLLPTTPSTALVAAGSIVLSDGGASYKINDAKTDFVAGISEPVPVGAHIVTQDQRAQFSLPGDTSIILDNNVTVVVAALAGTSQAETNINIDTLGRILVKGSNITVGAEGRSFSAFLHSGLMGVSFDQSLGAFTLDCLEGECVLENGSESVSVPGGQQGKIDGGTRVRSPEVILADYESWKVWPQAMSLIPTYTPTATASPTPTATITPTITLTVVKPQPVHNTPQPQHDPSGDPDPGENPVDPDPGAEG